MRTWRVDVLAERVTFWVFLGGFVAALIIAVALPSAWPAVLAPAVLILGGHAVAAWRRTRAWTGASEEGVTIHTGWRTYTIGWAEVTDLRPARIGTGVEVDRGTGEQHELPGVPPQDVTELGQLRAGGAACGRQP